MITITHTPRNLSPNTYTIEGDNIEELITECVSRIRLRSKEYYRNELRIDLLKHKKSLVDVHAGIGISYIVILI
jgi:hypothetical protein